MVWFEWPEGCPNHPKIEQQVSGTPPLTGGGFILGGFLNLPCRCEGDSPKQPPAFERGDCFTPFGRSQPVESASNHDRSNDYWFILLNYNQDGLSFREG
jgi:hypothetical protein